MDLGLTDHVAIVTGASRGLGRAIAKTFVNEGVRVIAAARSMDDLSALAAEHPGLITPVECDMSDIAAVETLVEPAVDTYGRLDIVVNNAGIAPAGRFVEMELDEWHRVFAINLFGPVALTRRAGKVFLAQGSGKVINVASTSGLRGKPTLAAYSSSKGAMLRFTEATAGEWASKGIQVNVIAPGAFETDAQAAVTGDADVLKARLRKIPARRMGEPSEIGPLACYLASSASDFVTGATFVIDGGEANKL
ncbi:SDR family NAD(P)-dependent oxidoreductase [Ilumatobacter sp.]|uniref:SDR family NAD(P)-dependent oxidoreductase n=1 Tax=Ilumatobacter sp. TaxID=1967498 RepID=UPI003751A237